MDDNSLLVIILAFVLGCMCSGMMKQICGGRLVEGATTQQRTLWKTRRDQPNGADCLIDTPESCKSGCCKPGEGNIYNMGLNEEGRCAKQSESKYCRFATEIGYN